MLIRGSGSISATLPAARAGNPDRHCRARSRMLREKGCSMRSRRSASYARAACRSNCCSLARAIPTIAGSLTDEMLASLAAEPGIEWLGRVEDVRAVWRRAAIAVLPSTYGEGIPKALIEAAACARPIVATDVPGCREIVRHGETGILVAPGRHRPVGRGYRRACRRPGSPPRDGACRPRPGRARIRRGDRCAGDTRPLSRCGAGKNGDPVIRGMARRRRGPRAVSVIGGGGRRPLAASDGAAELLRTAALYGLPHAAASGRPRRL